LHLPAERRETGPAGTTGELHPRHLPFAHRSSLVNNPKAGSIGSGLRLLTNLALTRVL